MRDKPSICAAAAGAVILTTISTVLDIVIAGKVDELPNLKALLYAAVALQIVALIVVIYITFIFVGRKRGSKGRLLWIDPLVGAGFNAIVLLVTGIGIICFTSKYGNGSSGNFRLSAVGLTAWTLSIFLHGTFFVLINNKTRRIADSAVPKVLVTNLGTEHQSQKELVLDTNSSFYSKDTTLASRSCTPTSPHTYSLHSSTTKNSIRSKLGRHSAKSSLDAPALPTTDVSIMSTAFDRYDTSNVDPDIRSTVPSSSPTMNRSGLETIPGSRPTSSGDPLNEVLLPTSPRHRDQAQTTPEKRTPEKSKTNSRNSTPTPKSASPPNFSRPTSRNKHQATMSGSNPPLPFRSPRPSASMNDLIHPLFRPDSPSPPQILTAGTMVTASPLANQPITPKTLSRLRSSSDLRNKPSLPKLPHKPIPTTPTSETRRTGEWRVMPPIESSPPSVLRQRSKSHVSMSQFPNIADSTSISLAKAETCHDPDIGVPLMPTSANADAETTTIGSPGPSIIDEDELPPILPGFVLSAGSRMSLVGYGKRKSVKREKGESIS